jgi:Membrane-bound lysozyme-inhibitor of c-type lysozyme
MRISTCIAAICVTLPSLAAGSGPAPAGKAGPPVIPYLCSDGRTAEVVYRSGGDHRLARAQVVHDGRMLDMRAAPALYGIRYRTDEAQGSALAWSLRGEEAVLSESPEADGYTRSERELLRCVRVRGAPASEDHRSGEHH